MKNKIINFLKFLVFLSIGLTILYLVYRNQNIAYQEECLLRGIPEADCSLLKKVINDFKGVNYWWILTVLIAFTISNISRAVRWGMLLKPLGHPPRLVNTFFTTIIMYFANLGLPRVGEVVRAGALSRYERYAVEKVMGTIVVERIFDVISILIVSALAILLEYETIWSFFNENVNVEERTGGLGNLLLIAGGAGMGVLGLAYIFRKQLKKTKFFKKVITIARGFWEGLLTIRKLDQPWWFLFHSVNIWFMYFVMTYLCFFAFEPTAHLGPIVGLIVFVFGGWGVVIPSPGGMGTYHFLAQTALSMYGISGEDGFSWANISFFSIQLGCNISIGILALLLLPWLNKDYKPVSKGKVQETEDELQIAKSK